MKGFNSKELSWQAYRQLLAGYDRAKRYSDANRDRFIDSLNNGVKIEDLNIEIKALNKV